MSDERYPCPCCGHLVFSEPPGSDDICSICSWQDDVSQLRFPRTTGANRVSLIDGQKNYQQIGVCEERKKHHSRDPKPIEQAESEWRFIDLSTDNIEEPVQGIDYGRTYPDDRTQLYYWRDTYWRRSAK